MSHSNETNSKTLEFDPVALREKFRAEREKRMEPAAPANM